VQRSAVDDVEGRVTHEDRAYRSNFVE
jgi:hypothetical protein